MIYHGGVLLNVEGLNILEILPVLEMLSYVIRYLEYENVVMEML